MHPVPQATRHNGNRIEAVQRDNGLGLTTASLQRANDPSCTRGQSKAGKKKEKAPIRSRWIPPMEANRMTFPVLLRLDRVGNREGQAVSHQSRSRYLSGFPSRECATGRWIAIMLLLLVQTIGRRAHGDFKGQSPSVKQVARSAQLNLGSHQTSLPWNGRCKSNDWSMDHR
jgi:hypothetical protein